MTRRYAAALILTLLSASGCTSVPVAAPPPLLLGHIEAQEMGYRIAWPASLGLSTGDHVVFAELLGDRFIVMDSRNVVYAIDTRNGRTIWRDRVGSELERFTKPQRDGSRLVLNSETRCHVYDIVTGELLNVFELAYVSNTAPLILNGMLIHGSPKGVAYVQGLEDGLMYRTFDIGGAAAADPILCGPLVIVASTTGYVFAFDPTSFLPVWRTQTWGNIVAQPDASEFTVFVTSEDRSLHAYARAPGRPGVQGRELWRYYTEERLKTPPHYFGENVYVMVPRKGLVAIDAANGAERWVLPWGDGRPFMLKGGRLFVFRLGQIVQVAPEDGLVLTQTNTPLVHGVVPQSDAGGDLYLVHRAGRLLKLVPR